MNNTNADSFLADGCGRCSKFKTPACKALLWNKPLVALRATLLASQRVLPRRLGESGFSFLAPDLEAALRRELGR